VFGEEFKEMSLKPVFSRSFSQVFLKDKRVIHKIISSLSLDKDTVLLEIGPGKGEITRYLVEKVRVLYCVEIDPVLCKYLKNNIKRENFRVINEDILMFDFSFLYKETGKKISVFGNLPYSISTPLIIRFVENFSFLKDIFVTLQREVAQKIVAESGEKNYGFLSVFLEPFFEREILFHINRKSFVPSPRVDSSFIRMCPRKNVPVKDISSYMKFVRGIFNKRRKKIVNILSGILGDQKEAYSFLMNQGITPDVRPERLQGGAFVRMFLNDKIKI